MNKKTSYRIVVAPDASVTEKTAARELGEYLEQISGAEFVISNIPGKKNIYIGCLCPGPVDTEFNKVAKVEFTLPSLSSEYVAKYAIDKMFKRKTIIIPGTGMKLISFFGNFTTKKSKLKMTYNVQKRKIDKASE